MNLNTETHFATVPTTEIERSIFDRSCSYKTTMNVNELIPIYVDEALPGDSFEVKFNMFGRLINPLVVPIMDELYIETLWFKCPNRLLWSHWVNFCGEQENPDDSIDYVIPTINSGTNGFKNMGLADYFGIPTKVANLDVNALPFRMYNLLYNTWFRDQNLIESEPVEKGDSDSYANYKILKSAKMHDYFTSCLPWQQKFGEVQLPIGDTANIYGYQNDIYGANHSNPILCSGVPTTNILSNAQGTTNQGVRANTPTIVEGAYADLSQATSASIADFRFAIQLQKMREKMARGGTRYPEFIKTMFNTTLPDAQWRVEFLGSTRKMIDINSVVQTSSSDNTSPQGNLTAYGVVADENYAFNTNFAEHSYIMGICRIRHNPVYQQGLNRMWSRKTLLDFYLPVFAHLSEQPVYEKEIYCQGGNVLNTEGEKVDDEVFGYQEAWAEYRYKPSMITGKLRSNDDLSLDVYHLAQDFEEAPRLNKSFIEENIPIERAISIKNEPQFAMDFYFNIKSARPMPVYSVPGLADHF